MGEIDRIHPILKPVLAPRAADRVQPGSDRRRHHEEKDDVFDLSNRQTSEEPEEEPGEPAELPPESGLDLSI